MTYEINTHKKCFSNLSELVSLNHSDFLQVEGTPLV